MSDTILVVEDDEGVRALTAHVLKNAGYRVIEARDGPEALALAEHKQDDVRLLVIDVVLPSMGGNEVVDRLLASRPEMSVLYFSGYPRDALPGGRKLDPHHPLLEKPFTPDQLRSKVKEALVR